MDIYASVVVVAGLLGAGLGLPNFDRVAATVVVIFVLFAGYEIVSSAIEALRKQITITTTSAHAHRPGFSRRFLIPAAVGLLLFYFLSGAYAVQPGEAAVVRRFGSVVAAQINLTVYDRVLQAYAEQQTDQSPPTLRPTIIPDTL